jgi:hypothetical protein
MKEVNKEVRHHAKLSLGPHGHGVTVGVTTVLLEWVDDLWQQSQGNNHRSETKSYLCNPPSKRSWFGDYQIITNNGISRLLLDNLYHVKQYIYPGSYLYSIFVLKLFPVTKFLLEILLKKVSWKDPNASFFLFLNIFMVLCWRKPVKQLSSFT